MWQKYQPSGVRENCQGKVNCCGPSQTTFVELLKFAGSCRRSCPAMLVAKTNNVITVHIVCWWSERVSCLYLSLDFKRVFVTETWGKRWRRDDQKCGDAPNTFVSWNESTHDDFATYTDPHVLWTDAIGLPLLYLQNYSGNWWSKCKLLLFGLSSGRTYECLLISFVSNASNLASASGPCTVISPNGCSELKASRSPSRGKCSISFISSSDDGNVNRIGRLSRLLIYRPASGNECDPALWATT